ncbi:hypothetical protein TrRE_jg7606, partial [Triparma retinervis]
QIIEVGPRDGLQNEATPIPTPLKLRLITSLAEAGLNRIEATAFVSPKWVPQMSDHATIMSEVPKLDSVKYEVLTPNVQGYESAVSSGSVSTVSVFGAASEGFCRSNINCTIDESIDRFRGVVERAKEDGIMARGYISCIAGCPFQGPVSVKDVVRVYEAMKEMGISEVSLGDTIGVGTPARVSEVLSAVAMSSPSGLGDVAMHFHDTYGMGAANVLRSMDMGVNKFDSSAGGLGGCPYAGGGASGNLATEDLVYMCDGMGVETGVDLEKVVEAGREVTEFLGIESRSKVGLAIMRRWVKEGKA